MFFTFTLEFGRGRKKRREPVEYVDDDMPHTVVESMGQTERAPIGFSVHDPWERVTLPEPEWEEDGRAKRGKR